MRRIDEPRRSRLPQALEEDVADLESQLAAGRRTMGDMAARLAAQEAESAQLRQDLEESLAEAAQLAEALRLMPAKQVELAAAYEERLLDERRITKEAIQEVRSAAERIRGAPAALSTGCTVA